MQKSITKTDPQNRLTRADASIAGLLESVLVNATDAVVITEATSVPSGQRIVYVNPAFTRMTGYTADDTIGKTPPWLKGVASDPESRAKMCDAIANLRSITVDLLDYRNDGSEYLVEISLTPVVDAAETCTHWIAFERDVSETRLGEERRAALVTEIRERKSAEARLAHKAAHDDLTGLYNRAHFMKRVASAIAKAHSEPAYTFSIVSLNLDHFKLVNDHLGHSMGDRVLRDLARRFEPVTGSRDTLARIGGDEFGLLVDAPDDADEAVNVAGRLLMEIANKPLTRVDDMMIAASIGIVHWAPGMDDADFLMRAADIALACSRRIRGGTYAVFTSEMLTQAEAAQRTRNDLYGAVERGELRLYYQPLVDIAIGTVYGFEGLVRWQHPERGLLAPNEFIPAAEETGLIVELGRWVLIEGCRAAREFQRVAGRPLTMSLNVSSQHLLHPHFLNHLQEALDTNDIDARTLQLEITENVFLAGAAVVGALFARIRALGIKIAFDDFGTGYSSLSYLERYQIDTLKIDKSFVDRVHDASAQSEILRMIVALAHALGVDVIAEGIERREQRDALGHLGCTHLQGFLFSGPITEAATTQLLATCSGDGTELDKLLEETLTDTSAAVLSDDQRRELREQVESTIRTHYVWLDRMHAAVAAGSSPLDPALVAREDLCPIGVWLNSTISETLRTMPLYYVTKSRHAVFHRSMARLLAAAVARQPGAAMSLRPDGDFTMVASSLLRTLRDWLAVATADADRSGCIMSEG
jgi:diguanylate cyclase (GGDEF)-like protein/PAS domain S-box-containing protein